MLILIGKCHYFKCHSTFDKTPKKLSPVILKAMASNNNTIPKKVIMIIISKMNIINVLKYYLRSIEVLLLNKYLIQLRFLWGCFWIINFLVDF